MKRLIITLLAGMLLIPSTFVVYGHAQASGQKKKAETTATSSSSTGTSTADTKAAKKGKKAAKKGKGKKGDAAEPATSGK